MESADPSPTERRDDRPEDLPEIPPLDVDGVRTIGVGTAIWLLAFLAVLPFYGRLEDAGRTWWLWTCLAGFGLGAIGIELCLRRRDRRLEQGR